MPASARGETERKAALYDLVEENHFALVEDADGPYELLLGIVETRLVFDVGSKTGEPVAKFEQPLAPLSKIMRNDFVVYDTYFFAIKSLTASQIQTIDVGCGSLHDEGAVEVRDNIFHRVDIGFDTAHRLFTLI